MDWDTFAFPNGILQKFMGTNVECDPLKFGELLMNRHEQQQQHWRERTTHIWALGFESPLVCLNGN